MTTAELDAFIAGNLKDPNHDQYPLTIIEGFANQAEKEMGLLLDNSYLSEIIKTAGSVPLASGVAYIPTLVGMLTKNFFPTADTYVSQIAADTNYGSSLVLNNSYEGPDTSVAMYPLLNFNLSEILSGELSVAKLYCCIN